MTPLPLLFPEVDGPAAGGALEDRLVCVPLDDVGKHCEVGLHVVLEDYIWTGDLPEPSTTDKVLHLLLEPFEQARLVEDM